MLPNVIVLSTEMDMLCVPMLSLNGSFIPLRVGCSLLANLSVLVYDLLYGHTA